MKPRGRRGPGPRRGPTRTPPPAKTGDEMRYLQQCKDAKAPVIVHLCDGGVVRGRIEYFDRDMIKITCREQPHLFVRKSDIRYVEEDGGA